MATPIITVIQEIDDQFCLSQLEQFKSDMSAFDARTRHLVDEQAPAFKVGMRRFADLVKQKGGGSVQAGFIAGMLITLALLLKKEDELAAANPNQ